MTRVGLDLNHISLIFSSTDYCLTFYTFYVFVQSNITAIFPFFWFFVPILSLTSNYVSFFGTDQR